jgi:SAM-dependent methyltransferase
VFTKSAGLYDLIYSWKDYPAEVARLRELVGREGGTWLDVACGTGRHLELLARHYEVQGVDLLPEMVEIAWSRGLSVERGDFRTMDLNRQFDVVSCLFSSIAYASDLGPSVERLARHVAPGGVLLIEPWLSGNQFTDGHVALRTAEDETMTVVRMSMGRIEGRRSLLAFHYLVGGEGRIEHFVEQHELWLWTHEEYATALDRAGLHPTYDEEGLMGRGLWLAVRPT